MNHESKWLISDCQTDKHLNHKNNHKSKTNQVFLWSHCFPGTKNLRHSGKKIDTNQVSLNLSFFQRQKKWNPKKQTPVFWTGGFLELPQKNLLARDTVLPQKFALPPQKKKRTALFRGGSLTQIKPENVFMSNFGWKSAGVSSPFFSQENFRFSLNFRKILQAVTAGHGVAGGPRPSSTFPFPFNPSWPHNSATSISKTGASSCTYLKGLGSQFEKGRVVVAEKT